MWRQTGVGEELDLKRQLHSLARRIIGERGSQRKLMKTMEIEFLPKREAINSILDFLF